MGATMIDFSLLYSSLPALLKGALVSLTVAFWAAVIGLSLGSVLGFILVYGKKSIKNVATIYVIIVRGTPMLIQLFFFFYALPSLHVPITPFLAAIFAIGMNSSAYVSQMVKGGLLAIPSGELEAAKLLRISRWRQIRSIIAPKGFRICSPGLGNEIVTLIKDSSLASIVGVIELTKQGAIIRSKSYDAFTILFGVALLYLSLTTTFQMIWEALEARREKCLQ